MSDNDSVLRIKHLVFSGGQSAVSDTFESREGRLWSDREGVAGLVEDNCPMSPIRLKLVKLCVPVKER